MVFGRRELDTSDPEMQRAGTRAFGILVAETRAHRAGPAAPPPGPPPEGTAAAPDFAEILLVWSLTHGFTTLLIDGQFDFLVGQEGTGTLLDLFSGRLMQLLVAAVAPDPALAKRPYDG